MCILSFLLKQGSLLEIVNHSRPVQQLQYIATMGDNGDGTDPETGEEDQTEAVNNVVIAIG
jgi:hypothetical protein